MGGNNGNDVLPEASQPCHRSCPGDFGTAAHPPALVFQKALQYRGKFMRQGHKFSLVNHPSRWPKYIMTHRKPRDWLMTISGIVLLFIVAAAVAMGYLVTSHPGKPEPNPGIVEEQAAENGG